MEEKSSPNPRSRFVSSTRRSLLCGAGAGLVVASAGSHADEPTEDVSATEDLMREHGILRRVLIVYSEAAQKLRRDAAAVDARAIAAAATLFRDFGEGYHERMLEEQHVFPEVRKSGDKAAALVDTLEAQHRRGREITDYVLSTTKSGSIGTASAGPLAAALDGMVRMYRSHAAREDTIVFPAWKKTLSPHDLDERAEEFEKIEHTQFGGDGFDIARDKIADVERALGLVDLSAFTAAKPPA
jgi:hemerythrin-like domain-containing protein